MDFRKHFRNTKMDTQLIPNTQMLLDKLQKREKLNKLIFIIFFISLALGRSCKMNAKEAGFLCALS